jgi:hypothetical protein
VHVQRFFGLGQGPTLIQVDVQRLDQPITLSVEREGAVRPPRSVRRDDRRPGLGRRGV